MFSSPTSSSYRIDSQRHPKSNSGGLSPASSPRNSELFVAVDAAELQYYGNIAETTTSLCNITRTTIYVDGNGMASAALRSHVLIFCPYGLAVDRAESSSLTEATSWDSLRTA